MWAERIQGTDGVRRTVARADDPRVRGLPPQRALLEKGLLTDAFLELYAYAYVTSLPNAREVVVGWDPRDPAGTFTGAVVSGVRKAGAGAVVAGVLPTPGVALHLVWRGADAAFVVTASHNFRDQNGVKIFRGPHALKLFPDDDRELTRRVLALDHARDVAPLPLRGPEIDAREEARRVFREFHVDPRNSWLAPGESLGAFPLVVDAANGALSGIGADVLRALHAGDVVEVNADASSGDVNRKSGVADLEGTREIARGDLRFREHRAVQEVFARRGSGAVFDADGDRFYRLDYDPESDKVVVLSGDETAVLQARFLRGRVAAGAAYVNTVESDLEAARAAEEMGFRPVLTAVGDKWVLREAVRDPEGFAIGSEETGHNITRGWLRTRAGREGPFFAGNGLKSAINTFAATRGVPFAAIRRPFPPGLKRTFYVYYTKKELLRAGSEAFLGVRDVIARACRLGPVEERPLPEEPDMLYLAVRDARGRQRAGIFVRNSGTEDKTSVNVRGAAEDADALVAVGEAARAYLLRAVKDWDHPMARAERAVLEALARGPLPAGSIPTPPGVNRERLLEEMAHKAQVVRLTEKGYERTELGARLLEEKR
jgi:phosphomannomutase